MSELFISHSSRDEDASRELRKRLKEKGHDSVFLDFDPAEGIPPGESWERTLYTKLKACRAVVALCSKHYLASHWCFAEIALARMEGKDLFLLQIEPWNEEDTPDEPKTELPSILTEHQYIDLRTDKEAQYERLWAGFEAKGIVPSKHRPWSLNDPPYPGLRAFDEEDEAIFFGRDKEIREGVELLNSVRRQGQPRMVMVLGSSGSGKSSLTRAGILPELRRDEKGWLVVGPIRPGARPGRELASAFEQAGLERPLEEIRRLLEPSAGVSAQTGDVAAAGDGGDDPAVARRRLLEALATMAEELSAADRGVADSVERLREFLAAAPEPETEPAETLQEDGSAPAVDGNPVAELATELRLQGNNHEASVLIVVDQFEELLGHKDRHHAANEFLRLLRAGFESDDHPPLVLGTMRSDFLGVLQRSPPVVGVGFKSLPVGPMTRDGMREIIDKPAELGKLQLEKGPPSLTERLLDDTGSGDNLPLLAFVLRQMWERYRHDRLLQISEYEQLGGLEGAIAKAANETLESALGLGLTEEELRDAFLRLARPATEGTGWARHPAKREGFAKRVVPALELFEKQRLLRSREDGSLEVAHEKLFHSWGKLRGWLDKSAEALHLRDEIQVEAGRWKAQQTDKDRVDFLLRGGRLGRAVELRNDGVLALDPEDQEFIALSERAARDRRRRKLRLAYGIAGIVGVAGLIALAMFFVAREQRLRAQDQALVAVASEWMERDPTVAALTLLELRKPAKAAHAESLLGKALRQRLAVVELAGHKDTVSSAAFSPGGGRIVTTSTDRTARLWHADGTPVLRAGESAPIELVHDVYARSAAFSRRGDLIVTASKDGSARIWEADGTPTSVVLRHEGALNRAAFSPVEDRLVTASDDGHAKLWTVEGEEILTLDHRKVLENERAQANVAAFSPDGALVVTATNTGDVLVWPSDRVAEPRRLEGHTQSVLDASFDGTGERIVTASRDRTARVWNAATGEILFELPHDNGVFSAALDSTGERVATASADNFARIWNVAGKKPELIAELKHAGEVNRVVFDRDGGRILTASKDGTARIWSLEPVGEPVLVHEKVADARFDPTGRRISTASRNEARVWGIDGSPALGPDGEPLVLVHDKRVKSAAFDPSGTRLVTTSADPQARVWDLEAGGDPIALAHDDSVSSALFDTSGERVVTASKDMKARVWEVGAGPARRAPAVARFEMPHPGPVLTATLNSPGDHVLTLSKDSDASDGKTARVWRLQDLESHVLGEPGAIAAVAFDPAGRRVVTAAGDGMARVWEIDGSPAIGARGVAIELPHEDPVVAAAFNRDGRLIVTAAGNSGWVWQADGSQDRAQRLRGHEFPVLTALFSPVADLVVTASKDSTARVWSADGRGDPLVLGDHFNRRWVATAAFDPTGERVVTTVFGKYEAWIWRVSYDLLGAAVRSLTSICLSPSFRARLGEDEARAQQRFDDCRACLEDFGLGAADASPDEAFRSYRGCILDAR